LLYKLYVEWTESEAGKIFGNFNLLKIGMLVNIALIGSGWFCPLAAASNRNLFPINQDKDTAIIAFKIEQAKQFYYADTPNYDSTYTYLNQALDLSVAQSDAYFAYTIYELYSEILYKNGHYREALDYYFKMLDLLDETKEQAAILESKKEYAVLYRNIGVCMSWIDWEQALDYFIKSLEKTEEIHAINPDYLEINEIQLLDHYNLGVCYFHLNNWDAALPETLTALEMSRKLGNIRLEMYAVEILAKIYEQQNDFYHASQMYQLFTHLKDSVANVTWKKELSQIESQNSLEKQLMESEWNRQFSLSQQVHRNGRTLFIAVFLFFLLVFMLLLYLNQRLRKKKNRLEQQYLLLENENRTLKNRQSKEEEALTPKSTGKDVKPNVEEPVWNEYSVLFQQLHQDFYSNLQQQHPNLTPNEKKLSAFIRLNMSSKEISSITFQSVKSIEIARSRLRHKLKLKRDTNLNAYLQGF